MKERPILFSGEMVRAILEGRKTQTRRILKPNSDSPFQTKCPYGQPGDRLWVRETWAVRPDYDRLPPSQCGDEGMWWRASLSLCPDGYEACHGKWRPSIHMPRWASRITLEITSVRVERLQDISEEDAVKEGIEPVYFEKNFDKKAIKAYKHYFDSSYAGADAIGSFRSLWQSINGAESWDANPWVWVIEFKRVEASK